MVKKQQQKRKKPNRKKRGIPSIPRKPAFKQDASPDRMSPVGLQEWTGDSSADTEGFQELTTWKFRDYSKPESDPAGDSETREESYSASGMTWPDLLHELFVRGQIGVLFAIGLGMIFFLVLYQDNAASKWEDFDSILLSLRKVGIAGLVIALLYGFIKLLTRRQ